MTSDLTLWRALSRVSPRAVQTTSSPSNRTSNSLSTRFSASSMNSISDRKENSLSSSSIPETLTTLTSPVPMPDRSTVWSKRANAAFAKHSSRVDPYARTIMSAVWSTSS